MSHSVVQLETDSIRHGPADFTVAPRQVSGPFSQETLQKIFSVPGKLFVVSVPHSFNRLDLEKTAKSFFEVIKARGIFLVPSSLLCISAYCLTTAAVIELNAEGIVITPIHDSVIVPYTVQSSPLGVNTIAKYLVHLLNQDAIFISEFGAKATLELAHALIQSDITFIRVNRELEDDRRVEFTYQDKKFTVGTERYLCFEPLFQPQLVQEKCPSLQELVHSTLLVGMEPEKRSLLWESLIFSGRMSDKTGLKERFEREIAPFISASETSNECQPKEVKFPKLPEYMVVYKDKPQDAVFLGGTIVAKIIFMDSRNYVTETEYLSNGPSIIHTKVM